MTTVSFLFFVCLACVPLVLIILSYRDRIKTLNNYEHKVRVKLVPQIHTEKEKYFYGVKCKDYINIEHENGIEVLVLFENGWVAHIDDRNHEYLKIIEKQWQIEDDGALTIFKPVFGSEINISCSDPNYLELRHYVLFNLYDRG